MSVLRLLPLIALLFAVGARGEAALAVLPLIAPDLSAPDREALEESMRRLLRDRGVGVQGANETRRNINSARDVGVSCSFEALACQARMGLLTAVDQVVVARLVQEWDKDLVQVRLLDVLDAKAVRETAQPLPRDPAHRDVVLLGALLRVVAPEQTGALAVEARPPSTVWLDGLEVPAAELGAPLLGLAPGRHVVQLRDGDQLLEEVRVEVSPGEVARVSWKTREAAAPVEAAGVPLGAWVTGAGAALAVGAMVGAGGLALWLEQPIEHDLRQGARASGAALLGVGAAGVLVGAAGVGLWMIEGEP